MKKIILWVLFFSFCSSQHLFAQELKSDFLFDVEASLGTSQEVGQVLTGIRRIFPVKNGIVKGTVLSGKILAGSADWGLTVDSTTYKIDSRATIETTDGALIYMTYSGYISADAKTFAKIVAGKASTLSPSDYYFRINPVFETSSPKYAWLNHTVAIGVGSIGNGISYRVYAIK
jgi:hypothetical protein